MSLTLITAPAAYPVTTAEAKAHLRVDGSDEDTLIDGLIAAAADYVEQYTGRAIGTQTWELALDAFSDTILLPKGPVQSVTSVKYSDTAGVEQTVSADDYTLDASEPAWIVRNSDASWPATLTGINVVRVRYVTGNVPAAIKHAVLLLIGDWYSAREDMGARSTIPNGVQALLTNFRQFSF